MIFDVHAREIADFLAVRIVCGESGNDDRRFGAALFQFMQSTFNRKRIRHGEGKFNFVAIHQRFYSCTQIFIPVKI